MSKPALVVIDVQNDYFEGGAFPLWNAEPTLAATEKAIRMARAKNMPVVFVQHVPDGPAPFFNPDTDGAKLHERVRAAVDASPIVTKQHADAFEGTTLHDTLQGLGADVDKQELAHDVGIDGAGASAEEAAMHITREPEPPEADEL